MEKKIDLEEILKDCNIYLESFSMQKEILLAMKEACRQVLELAAENAKTNCCYKLDEWGMNGYMSHSVNKESITNTINQVITNKGL